MGTSPCRPARPLDLTSRELDHRSSSPRHPFLGQHYHCGEITMPSALKTYLIGLSVAALISLVLVFFLPYTEKPVQLNPGAEIAIYTCSDQYLKDKFKLPGPNPAGTFLLKDQHGTTTGPSIYLANPLWLGHELEHAADALYLGDWWEAARRASTKDFNVYFSEKDKDLIKEKKLNVPRHAPVWESKP